MRIFIIDNHILFRRCMATYLEQQKQITIVGQTDLLETAIDILKHQVERPDIILIDTDLSRQANRSVFCKFLESVPDSAIVLLTESPDKYSILESIRMGAKAYLRKNIEPEALYSALLRVKQDNLLFPQNLLANSNLEKQKTADNETKLTKRELEILQLVTYGLMDKQIAGKLQISENTVKNHVKNIRQKLGVSNRLQASMAGIQLGITESIPLL